MNIWDIFTHNFLLPMCRDVPSSASNITADKDKPSLCKESDFGRVRVCVRACVHVLRCLWQPSPCPDSSEACPNRTEAKSSSQASQNRKWIVLFHRVSLGRPGAAVSHLFGFEPII